MNDLKANLWGNEYSFDLKNRQKREKTGKIQWFKYVINYSRRKKPSRSAFNHGINVVISASLVKESTLKVIN